MMKPEIYFFNNPSTVETTENRHRLTGYAIKYDVLSHDMGGYRTVFRPGAFDLTASVPGFTDVQAYWNHDYDHGYLGRTSNGTVTLTDDPVGLTYSLDLPDTQLGRDIVALGKRGDIGGASVGIMPDQFNWLKEPEGVPIREHIKVGLLEFSIVINPAFPYTSSRLEAASIEVAKSLEDFLKTKAATPIRDWAERNLEILRHRYICRS